MNTRLSNLLLATALAAAALACAAARGQETPSIPPPERAPGEPSPQIRGLDVREHLGSPLPMELRFVNAEGKTVTLGDYFTHTGPDGSVVQGKPAIVALVYYSCPVVCSALIRTIDECAQEIDTLAVGRDYNVLFFSFDHNRDTVQVAAHQKAMAVNAYGRSEVPGVADGWGFHAADRVGSKALADAFGFEYREQPNGEFGHPIAFFVVTPDGTISRYLYGFGHTPLQLKLALLEAGRGTVSPSLKDRFLTYCYMYDPKVGAYTLRAMRVMQVGAGVCAIGIAGLVGAMLIGEKMRKRRMKSYPGGGPGSPPGGAGPAGGNQAGAALA